MSVTIQANSVDKSEDILFESLVVKQQLTNSVDSCKFRVKKDSSFTPQFNDDIKVFDGSTQIFGGTILSVKQTPISGADGFVYDVEATDYTYEMDKLLCSATYEDKTIAYIIDDLLTNFAPDFNADNVMSEFVIDKIVFNQVPMSQCLKRLADIVRYDWYVDENKSINFFEKFTNSAPFNITDTSANYVFKSLIATNKGSQVANVVKVRGGEYNGNSYTDDITVVGNDTKSFKLPYRFANLTVSLDTGGGFVSQDVGIDFINDFTTDDVLHNFQDRTIRFENALSDGDIIRFSGNPKIRVLAIAEDGDSKAQYGAIEKIIRDNDIQDNTIARRRAAAELYAFANELIEVKFFTYNSGLRSGQVISINSTKRSISDDFLIKNITFKPIDPNTFGYSVELITTQKYDLLNLLQKIIEPEGFNEDENETSERIYVSQESINIDDSETDQVSPELDEQTVTISPNELLDPVDPGNVVWVLAPYIPTSQFDTKRPGRLDISMQVY